MRASVRELPSEASCGGEGLGMTEAEYELRAAELRFEIWKAIEGWGVHVPAEDKSSPDVTKAFDRIDKWGWKTRMEKADELFMWALPGHDPLVS